VRRSSLFSASAILASSFIASRVLGLLRDMILGATFGAGPELDSYFAAFRIPDLLFQVFTGAALGSAFIPVFTGLVARGREDEAWKVTSTFINLLSVVTGVLALIAMVMAPSLVPLIAPGFPPDAQRLTTILIRIMLISPVFFSVSTLLTAVLNAKRSFLLPALAPPIYNLSIIAATLFLAPSFGIQGVAIGVAVGSGLHLLVQVPGVIQERIVYRFALAINHPQVIEVERLMLPRIFGLAAMQGNFLILTVLASTLEPGSLTALNYAYALIMVPLGVFGMAISSAAFPNLAEEATYRQSDVFTATLMSSLRFILFFTIPAALGLIALREDVVAVLFERGDFGPESTQATAWALLFFSVGLPAFAALEILTRAFFAFHDTRTPVMLGLAGLGVNVALSLFLIGPLGLGGLALSPSITNTIEAAALFAILQFRLGNLGVSRLALFLAKTAAAALAMSLGLRALVAWAPQFPTLVFLGAGIAVGAFAYFTMALLLRIQEAHRLLASLRLRL
jgi:putative peptidoglycan lipid II flippase